eukprot:CAMPEP_0184858454 /NCGR_PEP_ID=MMETSP0580-20130426/3549_1 /TAXON_ID=1118495 /ORGANISM="Dactyliosolen fragilissimus" /LENGTH=1442 /DNA_ID=CAMNT_0027354605 /DNA_START=156 /DNA_END=4481 /DNA_ORIENTATION=+
MTDQGNLNSNSKGDVDDTELKRLRHLLRESTSHLARAGIIYENNKSKVRADENVDEMKSMESFSAENGDTCSNRFNMGHKDGNDCDTSINDSLINNDEYKPYTLQDTLDILPSKKDKKTSKKHFIKLTPEEVKRAKAEYKSRKRKLDQLLKRKEQKKRRSQLYDTLEENKIDQMELSLMRRSADVGRSGSCKKGKKDGRRGDNKKEELGMLLRRERAGLELSKEDKNILYKTESIDIVELEEKSSEGNESILHDNKREKKKVVNSLFSLSKIDIHDSSSNDLAQFESNDKGENRNDNKLKMVEDNHDQQKGEKFGKNNDNNMNDTLEEKEACSKIESQTNKNSQDLLSIIEGIKQTEKLSSTTSPHLNNEDFGAKMMASLTTLRKITNQHNKDEMKRNSKSERQKLAQIEREQEEGDRKRWNKYTPKGQLMFKVPDPTTLQNKSKESEIMSARALNVQRPTEVKEKRLNLPVCQYEYEIMDSIWNHSVTILCSETGSGKSTQVPQFLYEAGFTLGLYNSDTREQRPDSGLLIGVTQPRRVAAVATGKRVRYEMGYAKKEGIKSNLVAYQTRFETSGLGKDTRLKFMTDGILLQEVLSDLLLRKYAVIVLDEAHERNLNTDILLGMISKSIILRQKAAQQGSLPPLKLVVMSATMRVEDFTENPRLFNNSDVREGIINCGKPNLVRIPGRTYPVTIHHSKLTDLDDYEGKTFQKVCKIHRLLPPGGILVFMTGRHEILRMVKKLRHVLAQSQKAKSDKISDRDEKDLKYKEMALSENDESILRDMDDDDSYGDITQDSEEWNVIDSRNDGFENQNNIDICNKEGRKALVLPLYSLMSSTEQSQIFEAVPEDTRLIVIATNVAETSITIPGISYVVDTGRRKCKNYNTSTGTASFDVMWTSKASADQRAGRAGRTGPGHCYRLYSSSVYDRYFDAFDPPEIITRPLEDVVLSMKAMKIRDIHNFPFPTTPNPTQVRSALKLLANIGCLELNIESNVLDDNYTCDGVITELGRAVSHLPIGVRHGKILYVAARAGILDYAVVAVAVLSESSPFLNDSSQQKGGSNNLDEAKNYKVVEKEQLDDVDKTLLSKDGKKRKNMMSRWRHSGGDVLARILAAGAYAYAGVGGEDFPEDLARKRFCAENGLNHVIMKRIHQTRLHILKIVSRQLQNVGVGRVVSSSKTGMSSLPPPNRSQEHLLLQAISSGYLDHVARRVQSTLQLNENKTVSRASYFRCLSSTSEPLYIDRLSTLHCDDYRTLPEWICYDDIVRKTTKDGSTLLVMNCITPINPQWLGDIANGSRLLKYGNSPLDFPAPKYSRKEDKIVCALHTKFGERGWVIPPIFATLSHVLQEKNGNRIGSSGIGSVEDVFRWFARSLLEGKVLVELTELKDHLNDNPDIITRKKPMSKVVILVSALASKEIDSKHKLIRYWAEKDDKFLFHILERW